MRWARAAGSLLVVLSLAIPASAQITQDELAEAKAELEQLRIDTIELAEAYEAAFARDIALQNDIELLESLIASRNIEIRELRGRARDRAVEMYIDAAGVGLATVFTSASPNEVDTRSEYLGDLGKADRALFNGLAALSVQLNSEKERLAEVEAEQAASVAALEDIAVDLNARLEAAQVTYNALYDQFLEEERARLAEIERQRRLAEEQAAREAEGSGPAGHQHDNIGDDRHHQSGHHCSRHNHAYHDRASRRWKRRRGRGKCRNAHVPRSTVSPVSLTPGALPAAAAAGTRESTCWPPSSLRLSPSSRALSPAWGTAPVAESQYGYGAVTGDEFYYAHLDSWASGLVAGQAVTVGQMIGEVGTTGNAPAHIPHLHWEYHPDGGGAVNPTPLASALCG